MRFRTVTYVLIAGFISGLLLAGCASQSAVVATVGGDKITLDEFNAMYAKNNGGADASQKASADEKEKFLDLYVKFRLKVKEAYNHGYQNDADVKSELQEYGRNLAVTYLMEKEINEPALRHMYERRLIELRASHILIQVGQNASPADTLAAYGKAVKIIDSLKSGRSFEELAVNNSQDPSVRDNKGDLYFFTSGSMVPEFEEAAFSALPGTVVPHPVRTQFGYHIVKVTERDPNPGTIRVSHIMKRLTAGASAEDTAKAMKELGAALDSIKHGVKFEEIAKNISDDKFSAEHGGEIGLIERRRTVREFDNAAFKLKVNEVSGIVKTPYGFHIIKLNEVKPVPPFASMEQELKNFYQQYRFQTDYDSYVNSLMKEYSFTQSNDGMSAWKSSVDTLKTTNDANWDSSFSATTRAKVMFTIGGGKVTIDSVIQLVKANQELHGLPFSSPATSDKIFDKVAKNLVVETKAVSMESKYPDFAKIMKEYQEGIMLFKAEQNEVWNKVSVNDSSLHLYFDANRSKYTWPDRVNVQEISVATDSVAKVVQFLLKKQKLPFDSVAAQFNTRQSTKEKNGEWGMLPVTTNELTKKAWTMKSGEVSEAFAYEGGTSIIKVLEKDAARDKTFAEAGSELSSAFQEYESKRLENAWFESLKKKYPVEIFKETLKPPAVEQPSTK